jgi:anti-sigma regulatory factor (Ser/Thr protein kinase)
MGHLGCRGCPIPIRRCLRAVAPSVANHDNGCQKRPENDYAHTQACTLLLRRHERGRKPVRTQAPKAPEAITFEKDYPGTADQAKHVRADLARVAGDCPVLDELVLLASELVTNAILHSRSGHPTGTFTVRATLCPGHHVWVEVTDHGGKWTADRADDEQGRGLTIVAAVAGDSNWGFDGDAASRTAWFRLNWHPNAE